MIALDLAWQAEDLGYQIIGPFASVKESLMALQTSKPDVAMLDFNVSDGDIIPVVEELKRIDVPMVIVSGRSDEHLREAGLTDVPLVSKPTGVSVALSAIRT